MEKQFKLNTGMFAIAFMLICSVPAWSQVTLGTTGRAVSKSEVKYPAAEALNNFKADPSNPQWSKMQLVLLQDKAELEAGLAKGTLSNEKTKELTRKIGLMESQVKEIAPVNPIEKATAEKEARLKQAEQKATARELISSGQMNRSQFVKMDVAGQKQAILNNVNISDLVNGSSSLGQRLDNTYYIPVSSFRQYDIDKQIHILNNPSSYIIVSDGAVIPSAGSEKNYHVVKSKSITRAELNSYSPEKKKAIEESKDFVITD